MIVVITGVAGSGKTTIGRLLAAKLGWPYFDGDDFHPPHNVAKMRSGIPLTDSDREPWLDRLSGLLQELSQNDRSALLACSALKRSYRQRLRQAAPQVFFVYLKGSFGLIRQRLENRQSHYMPPELLASQFADLEEPQQAYHVSIQLTPEEAVEKIAAELERVSGRTH